MTAKDEWRELGFYYDLGENETLRNWRVFGSGLGLLNFVKILEDYTANLANDAISEHDHIWPYGYLKIMTWDNPIITSDYIAGTISDLKRLKSLIVAKLNIAQPGDSFAIDKEYSTENTAALFFFVMPDDFEPGSLDPYT